MGCGEGSPSPICSANRWQVSCKSCPMQSEAAAYCCETAKILLLHLTLPFLLFPLKVLRIVVYGFQDEILPLRCLDALR